MQPIFRLFEDNNNKINYIGFSTTAYYCILTKYYKYYWKYSITVYRRFIRLKDLNIKDLRTGGIVANYISAIEYFKEIKYRYNEYSFIT